MKIESPSWPLLQRLAFRFAVCYLPLYALCCGNATVFKTLPRFGDALELLFWYPFKHAAPWFGTHLFHLTGTAARLHMGVANDQALTWISVAILLITALIATALWSALDHRKSYPQLLLWFRLVLRICIAASMLIYGMLKLFPSQFAAPSLAVLNEPVGNLSPMTLLWTLLGLHPLYEIIAGAIETLCGILILFRRTALAGALLTVFVLSNVVLYNYFFDVPVKIFSTHLLLMAIVVLLPDTPALTAFFFGHPASVPQTVVQPTAAQQTVVQPTALQLWGPPFSPRALRLENLILAAWLLLALCVRAATLAPNLARERANLAHPSPLTGLWQVDSAVLNGHPQPYVTADGFPLTVLSLEPNGRAMLRATDGALYRAVAFYTPASQTLQLQPIGLNQSVTYAITQPGPNQLTLTPLRTDPPAGTFGTLTLTRIPTPQHYFLLDRGFHWTNEWGLER